jgi:hypothetical protein
MKKAMMLAAAFFWVSQSAWANYICTGTTTSVTMDQNSNVNMSNSSGLQWVYLCNIANAANGVSVESCKAMYAMLMASNLSGAQVSFWFADGLSCSSHPTWQELPTTSYGGGWYFGPALYP